MTLALSIYQSPRTAGHRTTSLTTHACQPAKSNRLSRILILIVDSFLQKESELIKRKFTLTYAFPNSFRFLTTLRPYL